jgi:hypothetical protein
MRLLSFGTDLHSPYRIQVTVHNDGMVFRLSSSTSKQARILVNAVQSLHFVIMVSVTAMRMVDVTFNHGLRLTRFRKQKKEIS